MRNRRRVPVDAARRIWLVSSTSRRSRIHDEDVDDVRRDVRRERVAVGARLHVCTEACVERRKPAVCEKRTPNGLNRTCAASSSAVSHSGCATGLPASSTAIDTRREKVVAGEGAAWASKPTIALVALLVIQESGNGHGVVRRGG